MWKLLPKKCSLYPPSTTCKLHWIVDCRCITGCFIKKIFCAFCDMEVYDHHKNVWSVCMFWHEVAYCFRLGSIDEFLCVRPVLYVSIVAPFEPFYSFKRLKWYTSTENVMTGTYAYPSIVLFSIQYTCVYSIWIWTSWHFIMEGLITL